MNSMENNHSDTSDAEPGDDIQQIGEAILRAKTTLIKPHSKYTGTGFRPRTPNEPEVALTKEQQSAIKRSASPLFLDTSRLPKPAAVSRHFHQRQSESIPRSYLRADSAIVNSTQYTYIAPEAYTSQLPEQNNGCTADAYPKWYPNRAGERTRGHFGESEPVERHVLIDAFRRPPTARSGQIIFDYGRPNDGYYLQRNAYDNTWFDSNLALNRRRILDSIQPKTLAEYKQATANVQAQYRQANQKWPHLSEYDEQYVIPALVERVHRTDLDRAKHHIEKNPTRHVSMHNQLAAKAVAQGRTLINDPPLVIKC